jgi:flagellar assembly factor FliW
MPTIKIQGSDISYDEKDVITFPEGLIGLPDLRRMVIVRQAEIDPLMWLVSLDEPATAFVVADARALFPGYAPAPPADSIIGDDTLVVLATVLISPQWEASTINLRAPLFVSAATMLGAQVILGDDSYSVGEPLPLAMAA